MGRETRQARRQRQRKQQQRQQVAANRWAMIGGGAVVAVVIAVLAFIAFRPHSNTQASQATNNFSTVGKTIDGIHCGGSGMENSIYHVHQHLDIYVDGKLQTLPPYAGFNINHNCLYWLHTHEPSGNIIHLESPHRVTPVLGNFFDIWGQPLSRSQIWKFHVKPGQHMLVYVDGKIYTGNPRDITLTKHKVIQVDIGPPFVPFQPYTFQNGL